MQVNSVIFFTCFNVTKRINFFDSFESDNIYSHSLITKTNDVSKSAEFNFLLALITIIYFDISLEMSKLLFY